MRTRAACGMCHCSFPGWVLFSGGSARNRRPGTFGTRIVVVLQRYGVLNLSLDGVSYALDSLTADNRERASWNERE